MGGGRRGGWAGRRVSAANWGIWGDGGLTIFFRGRNVHQEKDPMTQACRGGPKKSSNSKESSEAFPTDSAFGSKNEGF